FRSGELVGVDDIRSRLSSQIVYDLSSLSDVRFGILHPLQLEWHAHQFRPDVGGCLPLGRRWRAEREQRDACRRSQLAREHRAEIPDTTYHVSGEQDAAFGHADGPANAMS